MNFRPDIGLLSEIMVSFWKSTLFFNNFLNALRIIYMQQQGIDFDFRRLFQHEICSNVNVLVYVSINFKTNILFNLCFRDPSFDFSAHGCLRNS